MGSATAVGSETAVGSNRSFFIVPSDASPAEVDAALAARAPMPLRVAIDVGFDSLMAELGYRGCDPRAEAVGNRQRLSWSLMRADDVEQLGLTLHAADYLLIHASDASPLAGDEEAARRAMRVGLLRRVLAALRRRGHRLHRDAAVPRLWWARLRRPATEPEL